MNRYTVLLPWTGIGLKKRQQRLFDQINQLITDREENAKVTSACAGLYDDLPLRQRLIYGILFTLAGAACLIWYVWQIMTHHVDLESPSMIPVFILTFWLLGLVYGGLSYIILRFCCSPQQVAKDWADARPAQELMRQIDPALFVFYEQHCRTQLPLRS